ncbi:MAG TPA: glucose-6-phosphate dehydrogenase assembly protein OpcA [Ktedonobacteraceae bacterium]
MANDTANGPGIRLPWAGKWVRIEEIEEKLTTLWSMSLDNLRTGTGASVNVRTSVLNLVICTPDLESAGLASRVLRDLASAHLSRVAILVLDSSDTVSSLSAWVTLRCFSMISDLMRHCFEQTTLLAKGSAVRAAGNLLQPLLKPDLPVYLWWLGDPPASDDPTFQNLVNLSNRIIFDSTTFFNPEQDIRQLSDLCEAAPASAISDLNWGRLTGWRELISQFFDAPEYRPYLSGINTIEVEHAAAPLAGPGVTEEGDVSPNPTRALLLAAWLKERLGWTLSVYRGNNSHHTASGSYHWEMQRAATGRGTGQLATPRSRSGRLGGQPASITIRPIVHSEMRPGSIALVRLVSTADNKEAIFTIARDADLEHVITSVELDQETRQKRIVSLASQPKESDLLRDELEITGHDYPFEQTLQEIANLLDAEQ